MFILNKIGVVKSALFMGIFAAVIGFLFALFMGIVFSIFSSIFMSATSGLMAESVNPFSFNWLFLILFPILYGLGGLIVGFIFVPLSNLVLKIVKGIDLDLQKMEVQEVSVIQKTNKNFYQ